MTRLFFSSSWNLSSFSLDHDFLFLDVLGLYANPAQNTSNLYLHVRRLLIEKISYIVQRIGTNFRGLKRYDYAVVYLLIAVYVSYFFH